MADRRKTLDILIRYKDRFAEQYGITALGVFGSTARNEAHNDSDVDIVVKMRKPDLFYLVHIRDELQEAYQAQVDIVHYREKMNPFLKKRIDNEAVYV